jgi:ATP-dependent Clp protease ATP-binding subunit ClpA
VKEHQIALVATPAALQSLGEQGFDPDMGARPLRRIIQFNVEDQLSDGLLSGNFTDGDTVQVDLNEDGKIVLAKTTVQDNVPETL